MTVVLGVALVLAMASVCCGLGAVAAPWFGCELFATQIGAATGSRPPRTRAWLSAGLFLFGAVVIVTSAAWLATLGLGVDVAVLSEGIQPEGDDLRTVAWAVLGALLALVFIVPFLYAPMILVDRGGSIGGAALESARLVVQRGGALAHLGLSISSHLVQTSPLILAAALTVALAGRTEVPWAVLGVLPLLSITVPLGQGMIVSAWVSRREELVDPVRTRVAGRPRRASSVALAAVLVAPALSIGLVVASLARPSQPQEGAATGGTVLLDRTLEPGARESFPVRDTALAVRVVEGWVAIEASDGGGAGSLPRPTDAAAERVRVVRERDAYGIEVSAEGRAWVTWVTRAGVRLDDGLQARFADRMPLAALLVLGAALLLTPVIVVRVLVRLAEVRRMAAAGVEGAELDGPRREARRAGWVTVALLAPLSAAALAVGILAAFI